MADHINFDKLAGELELTELQRKFCEYFVFVTGLDAPAAIELAGYKLSNDEYEYKSEELKQFYIVAEKNKKAREMMRNPRVVRFISELRNELSTQLTVDKMWVINKLKMLATNGSENTQLKATELLGKTLEMFTEKSKIFEGVEDPAQIAKDAFKKRMDNIREFKRQENE